MKMITCAELVERLGAVLDGELDAATLNLIEQHLGRCHPCAEMARSYRLVSEVARELPEVEVPEDLSEHILAEVMKKIGA